MTILDWSIVAIVAISMVVGFFRGFVKEGISVASLLVAIYAALHFAPLGSSLVDQWVTSQALQLWAGRAIVFTVVLVVGGLVGWLISYFVTRTGLTGTDRVLGLGFGLCRGALLIGVLIIAGQFLDLDQDGWWQESKLLPYANRVAEGIRVFAPQALDLIRDETDRDVEAPDANPSGAG